MSTQEVVTFRFVLEQLELAEGELYDGYLLEARERLALVVAALDRITYPNG